MRKFKKQVTHFVTPFVVMVLKFFNVFNVSISYYNVEYFSFRLFSLNN